MASEQGMMHAILQSATKATKAEIMAVRETETPVDSTRQIQTVQGVSSQFLKQPTCNWKTLEVPSNYETLK